MSTCTQYICILLSKANLKDTQEKLKSQYNHLSDSPELQRLREKLRRCQCQESNPARPVDVDGPKQYIELDGGGLTVFQVPASVVTWLVNKRLLRSRIKP